MQPVAFGMVVALTFLFMEFFAWWSHRYIMHGLLWCWHQSHHEPRTGRFERNDLFAVVFAVPPIALFALGALGRPLLTAGAIGITAYGVVYALFHDGLVHRRFRSGIDPDSAFWHPRVEAHRIHHAIHTKDGCVSFGFLVVAPRETLKRQLAAARAKLALDGGTEIRKH